MSCPFALEPMHTKKHRLANKNRDYTILYIHVCTFSLLPIPKRVTNLHIITVSIKFYYLFPNFGKRFIVFTNKNSPPLRFEGSFYSHEKNICATLKKKRRKTARNKKGKNNLLVLSHRIFCYRQTNSHYILNNWEKGFETKIRVNLKYLCLYLFGSKKAKKEKKMQCRN